MVTVVLRNRTDGVDCGSMHSLVGIPHDETDGVDCESSHSLVGIPQSSNVDCNNLQIKSEHNTATSTGVDVKQEVIKAVLNAMSLNEEVNGSQNSFISILDYGKNLYCSSTNDSSLKEYWPTSWQSSMQLLKDNHTVR